MDGKCTIACNTNEDCETSKSSKCLTSFAWNPPYAFCVGCIDNDDSAHLAQTPLCFSESRTCVPKCASHSDCTSYANSRCDLSSGMCLSCLENSHCQHITDRPLCNERRGSCAECLSNSDCVNDPTKFICGVSVCRGCMSDDECNPGHICVADGTCQAVALLDAVFFIFFCNVYFGCKQINEVIKTSRGFISITTEVGQNVKCLAKLRVRITDQQSCYNKCPKEIINSSAFLYINHS